MFSRIAATVPANESFFGTSGTACIAAVDLERGMERRENVLRRHYFDSTSSLQDCGIFGRK